MNRSEIRMLLDIYDGVPIQSETGNHNTLRRLIDEGLVITAPPPVNTVYSLTVKGETHIRQLCKVPLPVQAWVTEDGKLI